MKFFARCHAVHGLPWLVTVACGLMPACAHTPAPKSHVENHHHSTTHSSHDGKNGQRGPQPDPKTIGPSANLRPNSTNTVGADGLPLDSQLSFFKRVVRPNGPFGESDRKYMMENLPKGPESGSVAEAALVAGIVRAVLVPPPASSAPTQAQAMSLESMCMDRRLDLPAALSDNVLLQRSDLASQVLKAMQILPVSDAFKSSVLAALKKQALSWSEVNLAILAMEPAPLPGIASTETAAASPNSNPTPTSTPSAAGDKNYESLLAEAQSLADKGDFRAAVKKAGEIPEGHPLKAKSQEKVRDYSNQAVQDLRRKAALAFQSALPVSDSKTKSGYLKQAKTYLEDAIKNFPDATQLPTVQDNLRVISADLEKLEVTGKR